MFWDLWTAERRRATFIRLDCRNIRARTRRRRAIDRRSSRTQPEDTTYMYEVAANKNDHIDYNVWSKVWTETRLSQSGVGCNESTAGRASTLCYYLCDLLMRLVSFVQLSCLYTELKP